MIDENKPMKQDEDNLEKILDKQTKRLLELNTATVLMKSISSLRLYFHKILVVCNKII